MGADFEIDLVDQLEHHALEQFELCAAVVLRPLQEQVDDLAQDLAALAGAAVFERGLDLGVGYRH